MKKFKIIDYKLLSILYKSTQHLDAFTLFKRIKVSFPSFSHSLNFLLKEEFLTENEFKIKLTSKGKEYVASYSSSLPREKKKWREVPESMRCEVIPIGKGYIPSQKLLDKRTFKVVDNAVDWEQGFTEASMLECSRSQG